MKISFLGTSGAFPTATRNATAHVVRVQRETLLLDCGEGTQQQLRRSTHQFQVDRIFLSHLHMDHTLGLPGLLWTQDLLRREAPLSIYLPVGSLQDVVQLIGPLERLCYPVSLVEVDQDHEIRCDGYSVKVARVQHHGGVCLGFRVQEDPRPGKVDIQKALALGVPPGPLIGKLVAGEEIMIQGRRIQPGQVVGNSRPGRAVAYSGDTRPCESMIRLALGADLLIHEAMFAQALQEEAVHRGHSTALEAAEVAFTAGVERLALTHISQRHQDAEGMGLLLSEALAHFPGSFLPADLDSLELPLKD